jgi:hypothetical protein
MTLLLRRIVSDNHITRIYPKGGILLSEPNETLLEFSGGAIQSEASLVGSIQKCVLCGCPSLHLGIFMTGEDVDQRTVKDPARGTFFGLCKDHDPHEKEDDVCDSVYQVMEDHQRLKEGLQIAEDLVYAWFERLREKGLTEKESLQIMLDMLLDRNLSEGHEFPDPVREAMVVAVRHQLKKMSR